MISIDTETRLFKPGYKAPKVICLSWYDGQKTGLIRYPDIDSFLVSVLRDKIIIGHNIAYDMVCLYEHHPELRKLIWKAYDNFRVKCTLCREKLLKIAEGTLKQYEKKLSLAAIVKTRFQKELDKDTWRLRYQELEEIPIELWPEGAKKYAIEDAIYPLQIFKEQQKNARVLNYEMFEIESARQSCYSFALHITSTVGIKIDKRRVRNLMYKIIPKMATLRNDLFAVKIMKKNKKGKFTKNTEIIKKLVQESYPGDPPRTPSSTRYPKGQIKTDEETIEKCNHPILKKYVKFKKLEKIKSTYIDKFIYAKQGVIHPSYDPLKETGRTSSSKPNIQNQIRTKGIRECMRARPGYVFIFCDYDSQEMRTLAEACIQICGKSALGKMYAKDPDFDPHTYFASQLLDISYEEGLKRKKEKNKDILERRQQSKAANFGFPGGLGASTFMDYAQGYGLNLTIEDALELRDEWFKRWPEMNDYFKFISHLTQSTGKVTQLMSGRVRGCCSYTQAANTFFQGLASDASKSALYEVTKKCFNKSTALYGCRPCIFVHDEIGIECPEDQMIEAAKELEITMMKAMDEVCPHVPSRATAIITRRWSKKAETVYDKEGNVIPWNM